MNLRSKLIETPIQAGDAVVVGLSGGADSVCLTHLLRFFGEDILVVACHLNHLLRGEESERDEQFVRSLCKSWEIPFYVERVSIQEIANQKGISIEEAGREARYAFFEQIAKQIGTQTNKKVWIATAHTLSDQAETILFRMARGTALKGLCGIPKQRGNIVRPLLDISREEIEAYCEENQLSFITDSSNCSVDYSRNRIRLNVIPQLKRINSAAEIHIGRMAEVLREEEEWLQLQAKQQYQLVLENNELNISKLKDMHPAVVRRILTLFLQENQLAVSFDRVNDLYSMIKSGQGRVTFSNELDIDCKKGFMKILRKEEVYPYFEQPLQDGLYESKTGKTYKIKTLDIDTSTLVNKIYKNVFDIFLDCGKISGSVTIRQKREGDSLRLAGRGCTKSLKKLFQEQGIPPEERKKRFIVTDEIGVIAAEGLGLSERVCCDDTTKKAVEICLLKGTEKDEG